MGSMEFCTHQLAAMFTSCNTADRNGGAHNTPIANAIVLKSGLVHCT